MIEYKKIGIQRITENGSTNYILVCEKPPVEVLRKIADLLNPYIKTEKREFIDMEYFEV